MKLFVGVYNDIRLLEQFLRHYAEAGVTQFFIAVHEDFACETVHFTERFDITVFNGLDLADSLLGGTEAVTEMRRRVQGQDEWVVIVDLDEFVEFPCEITAITEIADREGANVARGIMHDRFTIDGSLAEIDRTSDLPEIFPITSRFVRDVMQTCDHKGVLVKGQLRAAAAHHVFEEERVCSVLLEISHYKWIAGAIDRLRDSYQKVMSAERAWGIEYKRALDHYDRHGRFAWEEFGGRRKSEFIMEPGEACGHCGAPISDTEYRYSIDHFGMALCRADQQIHRRQAGHLGD